MLDVGGLEAIQFFVRAIQSVQQENRETYLKVNSKKLTFLLGSVFLWVCLSRIVPTRGTSTRGLFSFSNILVSFVTEESPHLYYSDKK
jgi:hypothetical protein